MIAIDQEKSDTTFEQIKQKFLKGIEYTTIKPITKLGNYTNKEQKLFEAQLSKFGVDCNGWCFSSENIELLENIMGIIDNETSELSKLSSLKRFKYALAYTIMQKICRVTVPELVYGSEEEIRRINFDTLFNQPNKIEQSFQKQDIGQQQQEINPQLEKIKKEFQYYSKFAHAVYGDFYNKVCSREQVSTMVKIRSNEEQFLAHCQIPKEQLLYTCWEAKSFHPAYCIALDEKNKKIVLCMRGTFNLTDCITDAFGQYICLKLYFNQKEHTYEIKIGQSLYQEKIPQKLQKYVDSYIDQEDVSPVLKNENLKLVCRGYAHLGIFFAALDLHKEITPKLEELFQKYSPSEYQFVITGHSLGGGMTQLLTLLYLLNPLQCFLKYQYNAKNEFWLNSYTFGSPPVLSEEFQHLFTGIQFNLIHQNDAVPRISFGTVRDVFFAHLAMYQKEVYFKLVKDEKEKIVKKLLTYQFLKITKFEELPQLQQLEYINIFKFYQELKLNLMKSKKLIPMGHSFVLNKVQIAEKSEKSKFVFEEILDLNYLNSIIFSKSMITNHFPHNYERSLQSVVAYKTQQN